MAEGGGRQEGGGGGGRRGRRVAERENGEGGNRRVRRRQKGREEEGGASVTKDHDIQDMYKLVIDRAVVACKFADEHAQVWWCVYVMKLRERTHSSGLEWVMHL